MRKDLGRWVLALDTPKADLKCPYLNRKDQGKLYRGITLLVLSEVQKLENMNGGKLESRPSAYATMHENSQDR
ncbi:MAG: hypothetical protein M4579_006148, partial [Chaenotheca gracillima]